MNDWGFDEIVEPIARGFEDDWRAGKEPQIEDYLPVNEEHARAIYWELVAVELELRLKSGKRARVEDYVDRFPLKENVERFVELIRAEYQLRSQREPAIQFSEYCQRFPEHAPQLIDRGIVRGSTDDEDERNDRESASDTPGLPRYDSVSRFDFVEPFREGGLGRVWVAYDKELERTVAIKELKHAADSESRSRFLREATATASLQHPGIVPVYGLGVHVDGRPFYAMRLVEGNTLAETVETFHATDRAERSREVKELELRRLLCHFQDVCQTIEYVHSNGILHRDLKPANIMIGQFGETVVVDWGLTKIGAPREATDHDEGATEDRSTGDTTVGRALGSPAYMSPEQAEGDHHAVGPRSDIYSLGATLLNILTGRAPVSATTTDGVLDRVKAGDIEWPTDVPGPLLSICKKAMHLDVADRYASAAELATEVDRYLSHQPVKAHHESWGESLGRLERQNRTAFHIALIGFALLATIATVAGFVINQQRIEANQIAEAESEARREAEQSEKRSATVLEFVTQSFRAPDPSVDGREVTVFDTFSRALERLEPHFEDDPIAKLRLLVTMADSYRGLGLYPEAGELAAQAWEIAKAECHEESLDYLAALRQYGFSVFHLGDRVAAIDALRNEYEIRKRVLGASDLSTLEALSELAGLLIDGEGLALLEQGLAGVDPTDAESRRVYARMLHQLGMSMRRVRGRNLEAIETLRRAVKYSAESESGVKTNWVRYHLAVALGACFRYDEAEAVLRAAHQDMVAQCGSDHPHTLRFECEIANALAHSGRIEEALDMHFDVLARRQAVLPANHEGITMSLRMIAYAYYFDQKFLKAADYARRARDRHRDHQGPRYTHTVNTWHLLAMIYELAGDWDAVISEMKEVVDAGVDSGDTAAWIVSRCLCMRGDYQAAIDLCRDAIDTRCGPPESRESSLRTMLAVALASDGQTLEAVDALPHELPDYFEASKLDRALAHIVRARAGLADGNPELAEMELSLASDIIESFRFAHLKEHLGFCERMLSESMCRLLSDTKRSQELDQWRARYLQAMTPVELAVLGMRNRRP